MYRNYLIQPCFFSLSFLFQIHCLKEEFVLQSEHSGFPQDAFVTQRQTPKVIKRKKAVKSDFLDPEL